MTATSQHRLQDLTLHHVETIGSTNDEAARLASSGAPSGTIVLADRQSKGRGRLGRAWQSAPGNLHASLLLRPDCTLQAASELSLLAGVVLTELLAEHAPDGLNLALKWPNDVLIDGAKVAGILLESGTDKTGQLTHVVIGIGVNIAWSPGDMPYPVTSLAAAGFPAKTPRDWLFSYASSLDVWLDRWQRDGFAVVRDAWRARSHGLGDPIRIRLGQEDIDGRFVDLTEGGALLIEGPDGVRHELTAGDVVFAEN